MATEPAKRSVSRTRYVGSRRRRDEPAARQPERQATEPWTLRRWEAAETTRLNRAHWSRAVGQSINADLLADLETLRSRAAYEAASNSYVEGVIASHAEDVVGEDGPTLQVNTDDSAYNDALEDLWAEWFSAPCVNSRVSGAALLKLWIRGLWINGEFLAQHVTKRGVAGPVQLRLKPIHPRRLDTPSAQAGNPRCILGVELSADGEPLRYWIADPKYFGVWEISSGEYTPIPAADMIHEFLLHEEDQVRGYPWLASSLQSVADMRDYDAQVLDAARQAADTAVFWYTDHPDAMYVEVNESTDIERRTQTTGPPGWKPSMLTPQQPSTTYVDYRRERMAEIGRPVGMPLMIVRLDSSKHNYSSARFDDQNYSRVVRGIQRWISGSGKARGALSDLCIQVAREGELAGALPPRPRGALWLEWTWTGRPHVDPTKEATAEAIGLLETGTIAYSEALAARGKDIDAVIARRKADNAKLVAAGLQPIELKSRYGDSAQPGDESDKKEDSENEPQSATKAE